MSSPETAPASTSAPAGQASSDEVLIAAPLVDEARRRLAEGDSFTAETLLELHLGRHGDDPAALLVQADLFLATDRGDQAQDVRRRVLQHLPGLLEALSPLCDHLIANGQRDEAIALLDRALAVRSEDSALWIWQAALLRDAGALDRALAAATHALTLAPESGQGHRMVATIHLAGEDFAAAEAAVSQAVNADPGDADSWNLLGVIRIKTGNRTGARRAYQRALAAAPDRPQAHNNLGNLLSGPGSSADEKAQAVDQFRKALALDPGSAETHHNLGLVLRDLNRFDEAVTHAARASELDPGNIAVMNAHANSLRASGDPEQAVAVLSQAIALAPEVADSHGNLALTHVARKDREAAEAAFREAARLAPDRPEFPGNLGSYLVATHALDEGEAVLRQTLADHPSYVPARINLGNCLYKCTRLDEARDVYEEVLKWDPTNSKALSSLAVIHWTAYRMVDAERMSKRSLAQNPDGLAELNIHACIALDLGEHEEARRCYRQIMTQGGKALGSSYWSNAIYTLHYGDSVDKAELFKAHSAFETLFGAGAMQPGDPHRHNRDPDRRLRIGYVSPDFRLHSVAYFSAPIIGGHDRSKVEVICYATGVETDKMTDRFKAAADGWRDLAPLSVDEQADLLRADQVDILVDLAGHTGGNALPLFARKPAPVQVTYCGYPNTTGLAAMDYRLVDAVTDPEGPAADPMAEMPCRLPGSFLVFRPAEGLADPLPPPVQTKGHVTFGSFNNIAKVGRRTVEAWAEILRRVPNARLCLKGKVLRDPETKDRISQRLQTLGLDLDRVDLIAYAKNLRTHMALYGDIDLALDTFPYNGTTTTFEALWMGVPVLCLRGDRHMARVGASILTHVGLDEDFLAESEQDYVDRAVALAADPERMSRHRFTLRARMQQASIMDEPRFVAGLEDAYRQMWQRWCAGPETLESVPLDQGDLQATLEAAVEPWR